jgi:hypothetical protein
MKRTFPKNAIGLARLLRGRAGLYDTKPEKFPVSAFWRKFLCVSLHLRKEHPGKTPFSKLSSRKDVLDIYFCPKLLLPGLLLEIADFLGYQKHIYLLHIKKF